MHLPSAYCSNYNKAWTKILLFNLCHPRQTGDSHPVRGWRGGMALSKGGELSLFKCLLCMPTTTISHPRLQVRYTGHEKTPSRFLFFWPFLTKTKQEWPLPGHIQSEFLLGTLHFGAPYFDPIFGPKMVILAIDTSNCPKWVENWLNKVEHCISHPGGSIWALKAPKNRNAKNGHFGQKIGNF